MVVSYPFYCIDKGIEFIGRDLAPKAESQDLLRDLVYIHLADKPIEIDIYKLINSGVYFECLTQGKKLIVVNHKS